MAPATVMEGYVNETFNLIGEKKIARISLISQKSFRRSGYYKPNKSNKHLLKAGGISKYEVYKKYFRKKTIVLENQLQLS